MNPILSEYITRFNTDPQIKYDQFFTQVDIDNYEETLPYLFYIDIFCSRVYQAILNQEKICIYSDYDTDAVTATATMYWGLIELGVSPTKLDFYAPDRFTEGYGMNTDAALELSKKYDLVISVDCGINSVKEAEIFKSSKCDLIITDHHMLTGDLPDCVAVINPRLSDLYLDKIEVGKRYLSSSVTGVGVAWFALVWLAYYLQKMTQDGSFETKRKNLNRLLPFVAIGTIADCQSVIEPTNRLLVRSGLSIMQAGKCSNPGLLELILQSGIQAKIEQGYKLTSQDLGFVLSPILNSSGRISHARLSISVLLENNHDIVKEFAGELIETNNQRKLMVKDILSAVETEAKNQVEQGARVIWLSGDWNKGIIGLLASRLVNEYDIPVIVISKEDGKIVASSRAPEGYNLPEAMKENETLFEKAGGHPGAAGFSADPSKIGDIETAMIKSLTVQGDRIAKTLDGKKLMSDSLGVPTHLAPLLHKKKILYLPISELTQEFKQEIMNLDPFGQDFPFPLLFFKTSISDFRWLGTESKHIKITATNGETITVFNISEDTKHGFLEEKQSRNVWVLAKISQNSWNKTTKLELIADNIWLI
jgi:single-stranded-DNA-specific exonuclease